MCKRVLLLHGGFREQQRTEEEQQSTQREYALRRRLALLALPSLFHLLSEVLWTGLLPILKKRSSPESEDPEEQLLFRRLIIVTVNGYRSTTSTKGSGLYDLIGISSQEIHKYRVKKTNLLNPVSHAHNCVQSEYIACTSNVLESDSISLIANEAAVMTLMDHDGFAIERD
jgi:hypothetical protein